MCVLFNKFNWLFNSLGQLVLATMQTENINIENLPAGIYRLLFSDEKNVVGSAKLMKN
ncbi:MAG: T9SS type A sorting domain-containing protein [Bacteroidia bacterium]